MFVLFLTSLMLFLSVNYFRGESGIEFVVPPLTFGSANLGVTPGLFESPLML